MFIWQFGSIARNNEKTAKKLGAARTAARIRDPQYAKELIILKEEIDIDLIINPEYAAADEIV